MKISIVTPSYNQGEFIEDTILSVLSQEGDFYIEYFIIDGGSTDNTLDILKRYEKKISEAQFCIKCKGIDFKWVSEEDRGQTHAINKGFHHATGDIVSWINSDDMYFKNAFSLVTKKFLINSDYDFIFGDGDVIDKMGGLQWEWLSRPYNFSILRSYHFRWNDFTNYIMQQSTFWRRCIFEKIGFLDESLQYGMDIEYWLRIGKNRLNAVHIPYKLGKFRMIEGTKSLSSPLVFWEDSLNIFLRYNDVKKMEPFIRYYFYNIGCHYEFDMEQITKRRDELWKKWEDHNHASILKKKIQKAIRNSYFMMASESYIRGNTVRAKSLYRMALSKRYKLFFHYLSIRFLLKKIMGINLTRQFNIFVKKIIHLYRVRKYLYRYRRKENE